MLQQFEYSPYKFAAWITTIPDLGRVQQRGLTVYTKRAKLMLLIAYASWLSFVGVVVGLVIINKNPGLILLAVFAPLVCILSLLTVTFVLQKVIIDPRYKKEIEAAKYKLEKSPATKIAVLGSYGKTTMKELLNTVLSQGKNVASTPGNKNVLISHARWVNQKLKNNEDVLIFEYGEAAPGDIAKLAAFSHPQIAVVTGLAPAHLDEYPSLESIADDFGTINATVASQNTFVHGNSPLLTQKVQGNYYDAAGLDNWKASNIQIDFFGTSFTLASGSKKFHLKTALLGKHQVGPLAAVVAIASKLSLTDEQIILGVAETQPFEHRMQARQLGGAWIVDDTYNGTIEGMKAGLELLVALPGQKKTYVTPGLVDQGAETQDIHHKLGQLIAKARPDRVVLMQNSATPHIQEGLTASGYKGEINIETRPLDYYTNLEHFLVTGEVVMLQNDWPDSYR